jgi:hypothetical protein
MKIAFVCFMKQSNLCSQIYNPSPCQPNQPFLMMYMKW